MVLQRKLRLRCLGECNPRATQHVFTLNLLIVHRICFTYQQFWYLKTKHFTSVKFRYLFRDLILLASGAANKDEYFSP